MLLLSLITINLFKLALIKNKKEESNMKGVSIPINTLVMLAVAIIVLLAAVAWFMGAFSPTSSAASYKQNFDTSCMKWLPSNCNLAADAIIINPICNAYRNMTGYTAGSFSCTTTTNKEILAAACGCTKPYGIALP